MSDGNSADSTDVPISRRSALSGVAAIGGVSLATGVGAREGRRPDTTPGGPPGDGSRNVVFIANSAGGTVSIVDSESFEHVRDLDVLPDGERADPSEDPVQGTAGQPLVETAAGENYAQDLNVSPDGRTLYVSRGHRGDVAAFDIGSGELLWKTPVSGLRADHMTRTPDGAHLFVSSIGDEDLAHKVDTETGAIVGSFETGEFPHDNTVSPDGEYVYNSSIGNILQPREVRENRPDDEQPVTNEPYQITVADAETLEVVDRRVFDAGIRPSEHVADERLVYAQLSFFHGFVEYDLDRRRIRRTVHLPLRDGAADMDEDEYPFEAPHHGLAMSPDEELVCVAARVSNYAAIVRRDDLSEAAIIPVGESPGWAANTPDGSHCVITSEVEETASFISYEDQTEVARVDVGEVPKYSIGAEVPDGVL